MGTEPTSFLLGIYRAKEEIDIEMACHEDTKGKKDIKYREQIEERWWGTGGPSKASLKMKSEEVL